MSPAADNLASPPIPASDNNLQPFFVLHRASPTCKSAAKTRRRIDLSPKTPNVKEKDILKGFEDNKRLKNFKFLWSKIESTIKEVSRNMNGDVFEKIDKWVCESFYAIRDCRILHPASTTRQYPIVNSVSIASSAASRKLFTALLLTKNMEFVDDIRTFVDLGVHLRSRGCHVANLTSLDFSAKNGVGGCLKTLLKQFLLVAFDTPDISILASWYAEAGRCENPLVVIIDDVERCCGSVLADFIIMLSEWAIKIPVILIVGVATTVDALRSILSSNALSHLSPCVFTLGTPAERMDAITEAVLLNCSDGFSVGKQVSTFLRNYFLRHDGTLTLFIRALKISMAQHLYMEPLSFILMKLVDRKEKEGLSRESILNQETMVKQALDLPSFQRYYQPRTGDDIWASGLCKLERFRKLWSSIIMCMYEVGKYHQITLLDLHCEMLERERCNTGTSDHLPMAKDNSRSSYNLMLGSLQDGGYVRRVIQIVRDLPVVELCKLLKSWEMLTSGITEMHEKVKELQSLIALEENRPMWDLKEASRRSTAKKIINERVDKNMLNEKAATFLECIVRDMQPIEIIPFNEIFFFNKVEKLQTVKYAGTPLVLQALIGDPRRRIQTDLLESQNFLKCSCCRKNASGPSPLMHDTSILYSLAEEHGDLINIHEWFHSFRAIVSTPHSQTKQRLRLSPSPKKRKKSTEPQHRSDASIQAEFCRAVSELQITGLLRMPSKRRPDYVQRVAFEL